jgi:hypothetical protein
MRRSLELLAPIYFRDPERVGAWSGSAWFGPRPRRSGAAWTGSICGRGCGDTVPCLVIAGGYDRSVIAGSGRGKQRTRPGNLLVMEESVLPVRGRA